MSFDRWIGGIQSYDIKGFANRDIRQWLLPGSRDKTETRRQAARVSRLFKGLHVHRLIAKIRRSRRWRVTRTGHALLSTLLTLHDKRCPEILMQHAA